MLEIKLVDTYGWHAAIRGMRNPLNSRGRSDTLYSVPDGKPVFGPFDVDLMKQLVDAGEDHSKFMRMIYIGMDINGPLYWWKQFDQYKVGTVTDSCSTMHTITAKPFMLQDFSTEHLYNDSIDNMRGIVEILNYWRDKYLQAAKEGDTEFQKKCWWQIIQQLPSSYNQLRTVSLNYAVARNIYHARKNHKLDEWHVLCDTFETLPLNELITM